jgi:transcriptional regulator with XRE-family HTH domain
MITGEQLRAARKLLGWSQMALALEASVDPSTVTNFETGRSRRSVLSVSCDDLYQTVFRLRRNRWRSP